MGYAATAGSQTAFTFIQLKHSMLSWSCCVDCCLNSAKITPAIWYNFQSQCDCSNAHLDWHTLQAVSNAADAFWVADRP